MEFVEEKIQQGMEGSMGGAMSIGGRVTKIDACLSNSAVYQMSMRMLLSQILKAWRNQSELFSGPAIEEKEGTIW
jgi:hypothetical protein